ncbi:MAG: 2-amino-4-hydroxy-6-hydroxymethyldihydropteridine diphosphokinase [Lishizhenia sp.]
MIHTVFFSLGGNHENSVDLLKIAIREIETISSSKVQCSSFYSTPPWGFEANLDFVNCVCRTQTHLSAFELLDFINGIEKDLGRIRVGGGYTSRPIDIDIIYFGDAIMNEKRLQIPHPRMYDRNFVLVPLNELASFWIDPNKKKSVAQLLKDSDDSSEVTKI